MRELSKPKNSDSGPGEVSLPAIARDQEFANIARRTRELTVERASMITRTEKASFIQDGLLLVCELSDVLFIVPAVELTESLNDLQFRADLVRYAGRRPYIVIDLNQQGYLPTAQIVGSLLILHQACAEKSKIIVVTQDMNLRHQFTVRRIDCMWTTVDNQRVALDMIDLENFITQRNIERAAGKI